MQEESINPYESPQSAVSDEVTSTASLIFFTTSTLKFVVMSICTFGLYELYWFYKNWVQVKARDGTSISPFWRAFFAPFWAYSYFKHVKASANENDVPESLNIRLLATMYFIAMALSQSPDPYWLVGLLSFVFIIPVNSVAVDCNRKLQANFENNDSFSWWNWVAVVFGGVLLILSVVSAFLPQDLQI